jgi:hypothetical protein
MLEESFETYRSIPIVPIVPITGNQTCHPGAPFVPPGSPFCAPWGQLSSSVKSSPHINIFFKKMLKDYEFDDDIKSDELQNDGIVMLRGI